VGYRRDVIWVGSDRGDPCPCGSGLPALACHAAIDGTWVAAPSPALLTGPVTGYAHLRCFARASNDCDRSITREHWVSHAVQREIAELGRPLTVVAPHRYGAIPRPVGNRGLADFVLCERHNQALGPVDTCGQLVCRYAIADRAAVAGPDHPDWALDTVTLCEGPLFERWLLKMLWGALASGTIGDTAGDTVTDFAPGIDAAQLAAILWRGAPWPEGTGFHGWPGAPSNPGAPVGALHIEPVAADGGLVAAGIEMLPLRAALWLRPPPDLQYYRPAQYRFDRPGSGQKLLNFCWPEPGHSCLHNLYGGQQPEADGADQ
jgi:hypothetical protein